MKRRLLYFNVTIRVRIVEKFLLGVLVWAILSTAQAGAATQTGSLTSGQTVYFDLTLPNPQNGLRLVLNTTAVSTFSLYTGTNHNSGTLITSSANRTLHTLLVPASQLSNGAVYHVRIYASGGGGTYSFTDDYYYSRDLNWDDGSAEDGSGANIMIPPDPAGGSYLFKITTRTSQYAAWRTRLEVTSGEADLYLMQGTPPTTASYSFASTRTGNDGLVLASGQFNDNQEWYILVNATPGSSWQLVSGDIHLQQDLGIVTTSGVNHQINIGPEGTAYIRATIDNDTPAWSLWVNNNSGATTNLPIIVRKNDAPVTGYPPSVQQSETGQMLLAPPYLTASDSYLIGVSGNPGTTCYLKSWIQTITDLPFEGNTTLNVTGYGYQTYRVQVPVEQIAWQVDLARTSGSGNTDLYIRQGTVPNRWNNDALSEAPAGITDSVSLVPPTLTDGYWYITVYGTGTFSYSLVSKKPDVTDIPFFTSIANNDPGRSGWRYYRVSDIASQVGKLGWQIELDGAFRSGREIAIRRNAVPGRWPYRTNDDQTVQYTTQVDKRSTIGILQDPNHPADIWYVGVYAPNQNLGGFTLTTREILPEQKDANNSSITVSGQDPTLWTWYSFTLANDSSLKGWDLRLKVTAGSPRMVVRRGLLPGDLTTPNVDCDVPGTVPVYSCGAWPIGAQWAASPGQDWTGRPNGDANGYLAMGMGSPLEPGTYYVGIGRSDQSSGNVDATPMSYTLESREIGLAGSIYTNKIQDISPFAGGTASVTELAPRGVGWYRVTVPADSTSWSLNLQATVGEVLLAVRQGKIPNSQAYGQNRSDATGDYSGTKRQKSGNEYFYKYAPDGQTTITSGDYYLAVVSEGKNPPDSSTIGSGGVSYTLNSIGEMPIDGGGRPSDPMTATCGGGSCSGTPPPVDPNPLKVLKWGAQSLPIGAQKAYRFRVPAGLTSIQLRLVNRSGNPVMGIRQDAVGSGRIPSPYAISSWYDGNPGAGEGGNAAPWSNIQSGASTDMVTIASPVAGDYTLIMAAEPVNGVSQDATYDLEVTAMGTTDLAFCNGSQSVTNQNPQAWQFYKVVIPAGSSTSGWDLRLKVTSGSPKMVVRRSDPNQPLQPLLPGDFMTSYGNCSGPLYYCTSWPIGAQWAASPGQDWTARPTGDTNGYLVMGMGSPLEPGTYYVGVSRSDQYPGNGDATPMTYTLESRGIGVGACATGVQYPSQVQDLAYTGGTANGSSLAPRAIGWYRVTVPAGSTSWSVNLQPAVGDEALLAVRQGRLPNIMSNSQNLSDSGGLLNGTKRQKSGNEYFYKYAPDGQTTITSGDYYLAVVSEGKNPPNSGTIGSGGVSYTLASVGAMQINDKTATPVGVGSVVSWTGQALPYASQKVYRFRVPAGLTSIEVRLRNKSGNPVLAIHQDGVGSGRIPNVPLSPYYGNNGAHEGGQAYGWTNYLNGGYSDITTISSPASGDYTLTLATDYLIANNLTTYPDATFDLEVTGKGVVDLAFCNGSQQVANQDPQTWQYFKVVVPSGSSNKGWDLRMKVTGGTPQMVVRRSDPAQPLQPLLPGDFNTSYGNCSGPLYYCTSWPIGAQWAAMPGQDWTGRPNGDANGYLVMGMGSPLEPGTYFVGVSRTDQYPGSIDSTPMSYSLESRGIGVGTCATGIQYPSQVQDLSYPGGTSSTTNLAPREIGWYRVTVPPGATGWSLNLQPKVGETLLAVRQGVLPNIRSYGQNSSDSYVTFNGTTRQKNGYEYFYKYTPDGATTITSGDYYLAVVSEGQNPPDSGTIGSGVVSYALISVGTMPINDKTATPVGLGNPVSWTGQALPYASQKVYRFRAPAGLKGIELRFKNKVGNPVMAVRQDASGSGRIPTVPLSPYYGNIGAHEGGYSWNWQNYVSPGYTNVVTIPSPAEGDYTLTVAAEYLYANNLSTFPDAGYDLEVRAIDPVTLDPAGGTAQGTLIDQQVAYYRVSMPDMVNGVVPAGWKIVTSATNGSVTLRVAKGDVPGGTNPTLSSESPITVLAPPYLSPSPDDWYIEVRGKGLTDYTLSSKIISSDPAGHQRSWTMPAGDGAFVPCPDSGAVNLLAAPYFGDSGVLGPTNGICTKRDDNPATHDQGIDLAENDWHYYRVIVPDKNGGILRTVIEAMSGTPELFLREAGGVPSPYHKKHTTDPNDTYSPWDYDRSQSLAGTLYGNWVPLDRRTETQLKQGEWWIGIRAKGSNIRYRLKLAAGNVRNANDPVDSAGYFQDLKQGIDPPKTDQILAAGDMRYYRVTVPQSSTTQADSTPTSWLLSLTKQFGDVALFLRDCIPPGQGSNGNGFDGYGTEANPNFQDWYDDNSGLYPNPYVVVDNSATLTVPPVKPGATYYLGVYALTDAKFDLSSTVGSNKLLISGVLPFSNGYAANTLAAGATLLYRIDVPDNAVYWHHTAHHDPGIQFYLFQDTVPPQDSLAHWNSYGAADSSLGMAMNSYPWQAGHFYYLLVRNTTAGPLPFTFTMDGRTSLNSLSVSVTGSGSITSNPDFFSCTSGTCNVQLMPFTQVTLNPNPAAGSSFAGWSGACAGQAWSCTLPMDGTASVVTSAIFTLNSYNLSTNTTGDGIGTITSAPTGINCKTAGGTCSAPYLYGSTVTLTATPDSGYSFTGWSGDCTGSGPCSLTIDGAKSVTATFATSKRLTVTIASANGGGGSVNSDPPGIHCSGGTCNADFTSGIPVTLTPTPDSNSLFAGWTGACTNGSGNCTLAMTDARSLTANFSYVMPAWIFGTANYYALLQSAYNNATDKSVIRARDFVFNESLLLDRNIAVTIKGGYDSGYTINSGNATLKGLTIGIGSATLEKIIIR